MKKIFLSIALSLFCASLALAGTSSNTLDEFQLNFSQKNQEFYGKAYRYDFKSDLRTFNIEDLKKAYQKDSRESAKKVLAELERADEYRFTSTKEGFIVCLKSKKEAYALCDDATRAGIEFFYQGDKLPDLSEEMNKLITRQ